MGPGKEPEDCNNDELVNEFENACRGGDYEFSEGYKAELLKRLNNN